MKIAILLTGSIRCIEYTHHYFQENLINQLKKNNHEPHIFINTYFDKHTYKIKKYIDENINDMKNLKIHQNIKYDDDVMNIVKSKRLLGHHNNYYNFLGQFMGIQDTIKLMIEHEKNNNFKYDFVIKIRHDNLILEPINLPNEIKDSTIYYLPFDRHTGYSDKFYFGNRDSMVKLCHFIDNLNNFIDGFDVLTGEYFVKRSIELNNLNAEPLYNPIYLVRDEDTDFPPVERGWYSNELNHGPIKNLIKVTI